MGFIRGKKQVGSGTLLPLRYWVVGESKTCSPRACLCWVKNKTDSEMIQALTPETANTLGRMTLAAMPWRGDVKCI